MEVCKSCREEIKDDEKHIFGEPTGWGRFASTYHSECYDTTKRKYTKINIVIAIVVLLCIGIALFLALHFTK